MAAETWLLTLHLIGAAGWVGGQMLLGPVVGALRRRDADRENLRAVARASNYALWGSLILAVATGLAMVAGNPYTWMELPEGFRRTLETKISFVVLAAIAVGVHIYARNMPEGKARRIMNGAGAGVGLLASLLILFFAAQLRFPF